MAGAGYTAPLVTGEAQGGIGGTTKSLPPWRRKGRGREKPQTQAPHLVHSTKIETTNCGLPV